MEENQTNQNLNQQSVQSQPEQIQQSVQWQQVQQQSAEQPSISMQIQELLVKQQQYQQQYNQLVDYVKKTPNLPIEQMNQIKAQLDQLNALFVQWKQKLQALWYTQVQVNKPTEVKKWSRNNFSFKKLAIWCAVILLLVLAGFFVTLTALIKNPESLQWIWISAANAKVLLQAFTWMLFWSIILLVLGFIVSNIYRLITVKNQSKWKYIWWLIWWLLWTVISWVLISLIFSWIWKIVVEVEFIEYDMIQPYLVWRVVDAGNDEFVHAYDNDTIVGIWENYPLIAPSEMAFSLRWDELERLMNQIETNYEIKSVTLSCGNKDNKVLNLSSKSDNHNRYKFDWTCLYSEKWIYTYSVDVTYDNNISHQTKTETFPGKSLNFTSEITLYKTSTTSSSSKNFTTELSSQWWEFILWNAPAKITIDTTQVFRDFSLPTYKVEWDMNWDFENDRIDQVKFDYIYNIPQIYYVSFKFPELSDSTRYRFPVRVEPSDLPVCVVSLENFPWTTKYRIFSDFIDPADAAKISSYKYTIIKASSNEVLEFLKDKPQEINYTFPEQWDYIVVIDYVTVDGNQWQCESDLIQLKKETFDVKYSILGQTEKQKFKEICNSDGDVYSWCTEIMLDKIPLLYQLQIQSITPNDGSLKKWVFLNGVPQLNDGDVYTFDIPNEWNYELKIFIEDPSKWMKEEREIMITAKKPDIVGDIMITSADTREPIVEGFDPLDVVLDASRTEVNVEWDEAVYFTRDFWDGEVKRNQQKGVIAYTYHYDYNNENWVFQPKVTIITRNWVEKVITWPKINVKKKIIEIDISSTTHPSRQAPVWKEVKFSAEFDWLPEKMIWDFWDGSDKITCKWRECTEIGHIFEKTGMFSVKLTLEFDSLPEVDENVNFKVY